MNTKLSKSQLFWGLSAVESGLALGWTLFSGRLTSTRLASGALLGLLLCAHLIFLLKTRHAPIQTVFPSAFARWLSQGTRLLGFSLSLAAGLLILLFSLYFYHTGQAQTALENLAIHNPGPARSLGTGLAVYQQIQAVLVWLALFFIQTLAGLGHQFSTLYRQFWKTGQIYRALVICALLLSAFFQWAVFFFQLKTFLVVPGWKWYFEDKGWVSSQLWFLPLFVAALVLSWFILSQTRFPPAVRLTLLVVTGALLQIGFGFIQGQGFESLRLKYADSVFNRYALAAAAAPDPITATTWYEQIYGQDWYLGTKPPGVLLTYIAVQKISNLVQPETTNAGRFFRLTNFSAYVFPWLAYLVVIPLYWLFKKLFSETEPWALAAGLFYVTCPNLILIPLFLDQVFYPILFILGIIAAFLALEKFTDPVTPLSWFIKGAVLGGLIYICLFLSFSLLPLPVMIVLWSGLEAYRLRQKTAFRALLSLLLGLALGLVIFYILFLLLLNYDVFLRYTAAMLQHRHAKEFKPGLEQILNALQLNNAEFTTWTGFPIILLFLLQAGRSLWSWWRGRAARADGLMLAFLGTYLALNLFGQTNGEVQRLWLFFVPLVCLYAAREARSVFANRSWGILLLVILQLITTFLTYRFQDFYG